MKRHFSTVFRVIQVHKVGLLFAFVTAFLIHFMLKDMVHLYYAFDEWKILGTTYVNGIFGEIHLLTPLEIFSGKARVFALLFQDITEYYAPYSVLPFMVNAYIFHFINSILVYLIVKKLGKSKFIAVAAGLFFVTGSVASQVFTWVAATYEQLFSMLFSFLAVYLYVTLSDHPRSESIRRIVSWIFVVIAYYFRETSIVVAALLPWLYFAVYKKYSISIWETIRRHFPLICLFFVIGVSRLLTHLVIPGHPSFAQQLHEPIGRILFNLIYWPCITMAHLFVPYLLMIRLSDIFYNLQYIGTASVFSELGRGVIDYYLIADFISFIITTIIFIYLFVVVRPIKKYRTLLWFALIYYALQFFPLAFYGKLRGSSYFDFRYYYVFLPTGGIIFALILDSVRHYIVKIVRMQSVALSVVIVIAAPFLYKQAMVMRRDVAGTVIEDQRSKHAIEQFTQIRRDLPDKPIIYLTGNTEYFYLFHQYIPMRLNAGYALMIWYYKMGKIPGELIMEPYHFDQGEGYRVIGTKAYGYFNTKQDLLALFMKNSSLSTDQVVGFYYDGSSDTLTDYTTEIKAYLKTKMQ